MTENWGPNRLAALASLAYVRPGRPAVIESRGGRSRLGWPLGRTYARDAVQSGRFVWLWASGGRGWVTLQLATFGGGDVRNLGHFSDAVPVESEFQPEWHDATASVDALRAWCERHLFTSEVDLVNQIATAVDDRLLDVALLESTYLAQP